MKNVKKWITLLLTLAMLVSALPVAAFAQEAEDLPVLDEEVQELEIPAEADETEPAAPQTEEADDPAAEPEEPVQEEPVQEEPVQEEPVQEQPVQEEPVQEEPVQEEPVQEEPVQEEPVDARAPKAAAKTGSCGKGMTWKLTDAGALTVSGSGKIADYDEWGTGAAPWASYRDEIKTVTLESGVTYVGENAFFNCDSLTAVALPASLTEIGEGAFADCDGLTKITIPKSVTIIAVSAFDKCSKMTAINVNASNTMFTSVDGVLFSKNKAELLRFPCGKSGSYTIPNGVSAIGAYAFYYCEKLTGVTIPNSVVRIRDYAFDYCTALTSVKIPDSVSDVGMGAFCDCSSLASVTLSNNLTTIAPYTFGYNESLTTINIPGAVTSIGEGAFCYCRSLSTITLPKNLTSIGKKAFEACKSLNTITIPAKVTSIGADAFNAASGKLVIQGYAGSAAETYAKSNDIAFKRLTSDAPKLLKAESVYGGVQVTWEKVPGAEKYRVFCSTGSGSWQNVGETTDTKMVVKVSSLKTKEALKNGSTYVFTVRCIDKNGNYTSRYDQAGLKLVYYSAPKITKVDTQANGVAVTWGKVSGVAQYRLYCKTGNGSWQRIGETTGNSMVVKYSSAQTKAALKYGTTYVFTVRCLDKNGKFISGYDPKGQSFIYLTTPKLTSATASAKGITVKWGKVAGAKGYVVYRRTAKTSWTAIKTITSGDTLTYTDKWDIKNGTTYIYTVRATSGASRSYFETPGVSAKAVNVVSYPEPTRVLSRGMSGNDVKWLQERLNEHGANLPVDGKFGAQTDAAVRKFQKDHKLAVDGEVGALTREALKK